MKGGVKKGTKLPHLTGKNACHWEGGKIEIECLCCSKKFNIDRYRLDKAKYCSRSCTAKSKNGERGANWKGGISGQDKKIRESEQYNEWRKLVYRRDNWTCQHCNKKQKHPVAHHILTFKDYPELRFEISNGITLCRSCHKKAHKEIGLSTRFNKLIKTTKWQI